MLFLISQLIYFFRRALFGKALLQLKMELYRSGITSYSFKIRRDGENIVLTPKYKNK